MKNLFKWLLVSALFCSCADKKEEASSERLSTNDVSFLMPLNPNDGNRPMQKVRVADGSGILSQRNFNQILNAARSENTFVNQHIANPANWFLVSFRYSPCIHFAGQENACKEHVRFVFQPYRGLNQPQETFIDYAIHVTYQFREGPSSVRTDLLQSFSALQSMSGGLTKDQPLQVHPVLRDASMRDQYFETLKTGIFDRYIKGRAPTATTFLGLGRDQQGRVNIGSWKFFFGKMDEQGIWRQQALPAGTGHSAQTLTANETAENISVSQGTTNGVPFNMFGQNLNSQGMALDIMNAIATNEHNVDCASCHVSDIRQFKDPNNGNALSLNSFSNQFKRRIEKTPRLTEVLVDNRFRGSRQFPDEVVTRIFGYFNSRPIISQRMVNDSALAADMANRTLGASDVVQCDDQQARQQVVDCLVRGSNNMSLLQCMNTHCPSAQ